ncbi:hypothetical protein NEOLEDRAFT_1100163 [Neolentinus lepideus HHB14362 ss-1]|uniref:Uncharacterized protein n=1 Tax=Neolentinus lepideus HHB14362 ss-1 TaxID=1314782 RepID=A0A165PA94_9AGAM|nr:hypothetical protein NEOLEDRAFT_1100163 [Neolentinus lepideus HHB14362 ss-1]
MDCLQVAAPVVGESSAQDASPADLRPTAIRRDTEQILSYYQSADAGRAYSPPLSQDHHLTGIPRRRQMSSGSTSPSDYSDDNDGIEKMESIERRPSRGARQETRRQAAAGEGGHRRQRSSATSDGGEDNRRIAVVQVESSSFSNDIDISSPRRSESSRTTRNASPGLLSRRGMDAHLKGLALVAPPDASPKSYTDLTPPPSAPAEGVRHVISSFPAPSSWGHQRSVSEVPRAAKNGSVRRKTSRDVGIVGTGTSSGGPSRSPSYRTLHDRSQTVDGGAYLEPPIFQTPKSRSSSPGVVQSTDQEAVHLRADSTCSPPQGGLLGTNHLRLTPPLLTPTIGEGKGIHDPVAGPVVVSLSGRVRSADSPPDSIESPRGHASSSTSPPSMSRPDFSAYLGYEPGVHSTAGPLPPPPRAIFDIDPQSSPPPRPPRLHSPAQNPRRRPDTDPVRQPMQFSDDTSRPTLKAESSYVSLKRGYSDFSINAVSVYSADANSPLSSPPDDTEISHAFHHREGAFPPSTFMQPAVGRDDGPIAHGVPNVGCTSTPLPARYQEASEDTITSTPRMTVEPPDEEMLGPSGSSLHHARSWTSLGHEFSHLQISSPEATSTASHPEHPSEENSHHRSYTVGQGLPSGAARATDKATWFNLKRFSSLPRTPSGTSGGRSSSTPSTRAPSPHPPAQPTPRPKITSKWPNAIYYGDVVSKRSALERAVGYAHKINELAMHDCGLGAWVTAKRQPGGGSGSGSRIALSPSGPVVSSTPSEFGQQPRHTSHGSRASEMTFPRRADAYLATDLSSKPTEDISPPTGPPPTLPYPSLAHSPVTPSNRLSALPLSSASPHSLPTSLSKSPGTFFSSIGRKTSVKKERTGPLSSPGRTLLTKAPPNTPPAPRPIQIQNAPSVPGGPRAPPCRVQRSQTVGFSPGSSTESSQSPPATVTRRTSANAKRPSFFVVSRSSPSRIPDPEFEKQLDKLADLLPQADRHVLAGYLHRCGQDIVAIGQYLEDERNGTIRRD